MEEKKVKFTVIDAVIILVVAAVLAVGATKLFSKMLKPKSNEKVAYTVLIQNQDKNFADAIGIGDKVTVSLTEKDGGVIKDVKSEPAKAISFNSIDGTYAEQTIEDKNDVYVTIESTVTSDDLAIKVGDTPIKVGAEIPVRGKGYASSGYVIEIND